ncbi:MAG: methyltransferase domain-containing protein [Candidatus Aenigmatarchaeota archaeon]
MTPPLFSGNVTEMMNFSKDGDILIVGLGEGYSTVFFSEFTNNSANLYGIEILGEVLGRSSEKLKREGYEVELMQGNGIRGWKNDRKFDYIWTTLAVKEVPDNWLNILREGGNLGVFRKLTEKEFKNVKDFSWFPFENYKEYEDRWWEQVCLEILHKNDDGSVETKNKSYNVFNAPFLDDEYGEKTDINWPKKYGKIQRKLVNFLSR